MANVISVNKKDTSAPTNNQGKKAPLFRKMNYILMGIGLLLLVIGYCLFRGGAVDDPNTFNPELFNTRRMVVAPILMLLGLVTEIFAIMWHPKQNKSTSEPKNN